jgi:hypothetical protein
MQTAGAPLLVLDELDPDELVLDELDPPSFSFGSSMMISFAQAASVIDKPNKPTSVFFIPR